MLVPPDAPAIIELRSANGQGDANLLESGHSLFRRRPVINLKRILVPTDFSESARHALLYGTSFAREYEGELVLLHVVENLTVGYASDLFPVPMAEVFDEISGYAKAELAKLGAEVKEKGIAVRELVVQGKPSAEIVRVAREETADMIVLGTHGKGMLDKALFGSTAERVIRRAPCPVLTVGLEEHEFVQET
jgi:nucleotide-binding universal stress UspA family protein